MYCNDDTINCYLSSRKINILDFFDQSVYRVLVLYTKQKMMDCACHSVVQLA